MPDDVCRCGHGTQAHQHYRRGRDCALCECARYRGVRTAPVGWRTWLSDRRRSPS